MSQFMSTPDVMQVCTNGHVVTKALPANLDGGLAHCDRCGQPTLDRCRTCGELLRSAPTALGLSTVGHLRPPDYCPACGAAFPWTAAPTVANNTIDRPNGIDVETLLRRLPRALRQLRSRHGNRPAFRVVDVLDLEDLLRALLPLVSDDVRQESRTPSYADGTRLDFRLPSESLVVMIKHADSLRAHSLSDQLAEDVAYYVRLRFEGLLLVVVYDPEGKIHDPATVEQISTRVQDGLAVRCIVAV
jgi:hypothetical protein